jgi:tetratricopeptide (TPR) repeat protein
VREDHGDVDAALEDLWGLGLSGLEDEARAHAEKMKLLRIPGLVVFKPDDQASGKPSWLRFNDEGEKSEDPEAEARRIEDHQAQDWALLGDRLKGRRMYQAAVIEYDKALGRLGQSEPLTVNKKAHALLLMGRPQDALPVLEESLVYAPDLAVTLDNLAEAHLALAASSKDEAAADAHRKAALGLAQESERINPFSMDTHVRLATLYERFGRTEDAARARERIALLRQER